MKTCPKCGAENLQTASSCRLCAVPLEAPESLLGVRADMPLSEQLPSMDLISGDDPSHKSAQGSSSPIRNICPGCSTPNEPEWLFCQHCGSRLTGAHQIVISEDDVPTDPMGRKEPERQEVSPAESLASEKKTEERRGYKPEPAIRPQPRKPPAARPELGLITNFDPRGDDENQIFVTNVDHNLDARVECESCGATQHDEGPFCTSCGQKLSAFSLARQKAQEVSRPVPSLKLIVEGGKEGQTFSLNHKETLIGRSQGDITFPHDGYMSSRHSMVVERDGRYFLLDEDSRNGTFIRITGETELQPDDMFLVGKQILRFEKL